MKLLSLFLLCFSVNCYSIDWPSGQYTIDSLNKLQLGEFKNYFNLVSTKFPIRVVDHGRSLEVLSYGEIVLKGTVKRKADGRAVILYQSFKDGGVFVYRIVIEDVENISHYELLTFDIFDKLNNSDLNISFPDSNFIIDVATEDAIKLAVYRFGWGSINLREKSTETELSSRFWYNCPSCNGDPLYLVIKKSGANIYKKFYQGLLQKEVSAKLFYQEANGFYLSALVRELKNELNTLVRQKGWPSSK